jgi:coenzyme F420-0:L-glutamate ligase/coenzyme F420-1:gamma-L-glutamate ligase
MRELRVIPVGGLPEFAPGMEIGTEIAARAGPRAGDVVVISQKIVSKAEGRVRSLAEVEPGAKARRIAAELDKDAATVELILAESREVLRAERGVLIVETQHGFVCANAGIDASNLPGDGTVALLPENPDASARRIRAEIQQATDGKRRQADKSTGIAPAVIVADSFGRAWRLGQAEVAIGCAGIAPLDDWRGQADTAGRKLEATTIAIADQVAAAADLVRDKTSQVPAVIVRGLDRHVTQEDGPGATAILRPRSEDLFR